MKYALGWKRSSGNLGVKPFTRTGKVEELASQITTDQHLIPEYVPIFDQLTLNSCVANAGCALWGILRGIEDPNAHLILSRLFLYWNTRLANGDTNKDEGGYIHLAMKSLTTLGVCLETTWSYNPRKVFKQPPLKAFKQGDDNTLKDFYQITTQHDQRLLDIETAIKANHPVVFGTLVGDELENYAGGNQVLGPPANPLGGHALLVVGVRRNPNLEFYIRNSWGAFWGQHGHVWFNSDYMASDDTSDLFVGTRMPNLLV